MSFISTMTQHGFYTLPNWIEFSDGAVVNGSNPSLQPLVEFNEKLCLRAMLQGLGRYHFKPVKKSVVSIFLNISSFHSMVLNESP